MSEHISHISSEEVERVYTVLRRCLDPFFLVSALGDISLLIESRDRAVSEAWITHMLIMELADFLPHEAGMPTGDITAMVGQADGESALARVLIREGLARQGSYFLYKFQERLRTSSKENMPGVPVLTRPIYSLMYETLMKHGSSKV